MYVNIGAPGAVSPSQNTAFLPNEPEIKWDDKRESSRHVAEAEASVPVLVTCAFEMRAMPRFTDLFKIVWIKHMNEHPR
jgi:hypothetical protein